MRAVAKRSRLGAKIVTLSAWVCWALPAARAATGVDEATRAAARDIGYTGVEAFQRGDYGIAHERLEKAYAILHAPSLGLWSARALVKVGHLVEAHERYLEVSRLPTSVGDEAVQVRARADARAEAATLAPRVPWLVVLVQGAPRQSVDVTIDGVHLQAELLGESRPVNPGRHVVRGVARTATTEEVVELGEGDHKTVALSLVAPPAAEPEHAVTPIAAPPAAAPESQPPLVDAREPGPRARGLRQVGWVAVAVGGVGIATGAIAGALAMSARNDLDCPNNICAMGTDADVKRFNRLLVISTVGFIAGGVLAAAGVALVLSPSRSSAASGRGAGASARLTFAVSPGAVALRADF